MTEVSQVKPSLQIEFSSNYTPTIPVAPCIVCSSIHRWPKSTSLEGLNPVYPGPEVPLEQSVGLPGVNFRKKNPIKSFHGRFFRALERVFPHHFCALGVEKTRILYVLDFLDDFWLLRCRLRSPHSSLGPSVRTLALHRAGGSSRLAGARQQTRRTRH